MSISFYPPITEPTVNWKHIDGPVMYRRDGTMYWLRFSDRINYMFGRWNLWEIERRSYGRRWS